MLATNAIPSTSVVAPDATSMVTNAPGREMRRLMGDEKRVGGAGLIAAKAAAGCADSRSCPLSPSTVDAVTARATTNNATNPTIIHGRSGINRCGERCGGATPVPPCCAGETTCTDGLTGQ